MTSNDTILPTVNTMNNSGEIVLYQPNDEIRLDVRLENETVWLNISQMAELFGRDRSVINRHISNIFKEGEVDSSLGCAKFAYTNKYGRQDGFEQHNTEPIETVVWSKPSHDRWLIVDEVVYHCGHSLKDMGKKMCAISRMGCNAETILGQVR